MADVQPQGEGSKAEFEQFLSKLPKPISFLRTIFDGSNMHKQYLLCFSRQVPEGGTPKIGYYSLQEVKQDEWKDGFHIDPKIITIKEFATIQGLPEPLDYCQLLREKLPTLGTSGWNLIVKAVQARRTDSISEQAVAALFLPVLTEKPSDMECLNHFFSPRVVCSALDKKDMTVKSKIMSSFENFYLPSTSTPQQRKDRDLSCALPTAKKLEFQERERLIHAIVGLTKDDRVLDVNVRVGMIVHQRQAGDIYYAWDGTTASLFRDAGSVANAEFADANNLRGLRMRQQVVAGGAGGVVPGYAQVAAGGGHGGMPVNAQGGLVPMALTNRVLFWAFKTKVEKTVKLEGQDQDQEYNLKKWNPLLQSKSFSGLRRVEPNEKVKVFDVTTRAEKDILVYPLYKEFLQKHVAPVLGEFKDQIAQVCEYVIKDAWQSPLPGTVPIFMRTSLLSQNGINRQSMEHARYALQHLVRSKSQTFISAEMSWVMESFNDTTVLKNIVDNVASELLMFGPLAKNLARDLLWMLLTAYHNPLVEDEPDFDGFLQMGNLPSVYDTKPEEIRVDLTVDDELGLDAQLPAGGGAAPIRIGDGGALQLLAGAGQAPAGGGDGGAIQLLAGVGQAPAGGGDGGAGPDAQDNPGDQDGRRNKRARRPATHYKPGRG